MDSRDMLILGGAAVAAYFGWKWWTGRTSAQASANNKTAITDGKARVASAMTLDAARTTNFGGITSVRQIAAAPALSSASAIRLPRPTDPAGMTPETTGLRAFIRRAVLGPLPLAPSPDSFRLVPGEVGSSAVNGTVPKGDAPNPGDPSTVYIRTTGIN